MLLKFNRLAKLTTDASVIAESIKSGSTLVEANAEGSSLRRSPNAPLPSEAATNKCSIYVKGFPLDLESFDPVEKVFTALGYKVR